MAALLMLSGCGTEGDEATSSASPAASPTGPSQQEQVEEACALAVEGRLKAPATAEYGPVQSEQLNRVWTVAGTVDSENGFGALIRNTYECTAIWDAQAETASVSKVNFED